jgi:nickel-type superoxide dismutase maturation protease
MHWPLTRIAVVERSMEPVLLPGDWLLVWRGIRARRAPRVRPGQLVIAEHPAQPGMLLVKRAASQVGDGWWVEAENPGAGATDSSSFGPVPVRCIYGRVLLRYWRHRTR